MVLFPFYRYHLFDDPFFLHRFDLFEPWYDFHMFPLFPSILPRSQRVHQQGRLTYSSSSKTSRSKSLDLASRAPQTDKFRVQLNIDGFNPNTITKRIEGRKLLIEGKQEERRGVHNYSIRELRESHDLPEHADANRLTSYVTPNNMLVVEVPIQNPESERRFQQPQNNNRSVTQFDQNRDSVFDDNEFWNGSDFRAHIVDKGNNQKQLEMGVEMKNFRPEEVNVSVRNNELIVQGEHRYNDANRSERSSFYKSTTLPPGTQVDQLQSRFHGDGRLKIEAPFF